jgi:hypothetical protein
MTTAPTISPEEWKPGLCECGCGGRTRLAPQSHTKNRYVRGEPIRFINGHNPKNQPAGSSHPSWAGDRVTHSGVHRWLRDHFPKAGMCEDCGKQGRTHYASVNGHVYTRNRDDYAELCPSCHNKRDYEEGRRQPRGPDKKPRRKAHVPSL